MCGARSVYTSCDPCRNAADEAELEKVGEEGLPFLDQASNGSVTTSSDDISEEDESDVNLLRAEVSAWVDSPYPCRFCGCPFWNGEGKFVCYCREDG